MSYREENYVAGDSFYRRWQVLNEDGTPHNLTGATVRLHIRDKDNTLMVEATTGNGRITLTPASGQITVNIAHADMSSVVATSHPYYYDLEVTFASGRRLTLDRVMLHVLRNHTI